MTLNEALDFIDVGNQHILVSNKDANEYYYNYLYQLEEDEENRERLLSSEVLNVDIDGCDNTVIFYLW